MKIWTAGTPLSMKLSWSDDSRPSGIGRGSTPVEALLLAREGEIVDAEGRSVVEPGEFEILVGPSSRDRDL